MFSFLLLDKIQFYFHKYCYFAWLKNSIAIFPTPNHLKRQKTWPWTQHHETHLWRIIRIEATPGALWTRGWARGTVHRHLRDELPQRSGGDCWRASRVTGNVIGQRDSPRRAGDSPVGCSTLCLMVYWRLATCCLVLFPKLRDRRQVPHGVRKLSVLLVLNGQTGQLRWEAAELHILWWSRAESYKGKLSSLLICLEKSVYGRADKAS